MLQSPLDISCKRLRQWLFISFHAQVFSSQSDSQLNTELLKLKSGSELLYNWRFTTSQFILASSPLRLTTRDFFQLNPCGHRPYVTPSLTRGWVCLFHAWPFSKCTCHTYSLLLKILPFALYTSTVSIQALQSRSCYLTYLMLRLQLSHLSGHKLDHCQV
jgi:hypothetical protein